MATVSEKNYLQKFWEEQCSVFFKNLSSIRIRPEKRNIHDLRVAIKKMRSVLRLAVLFSGEKVKPEFNSVRMLFRLYGKYRDVDISIFLLRKIVKDEKLELPSFLRNLRMMLSITRDLAKREAEKDHEKEILNLTDRLNQILNSVSNEMLEMKIQEQSAILFSDIKNMTQKFSKQAHEVRKHLKLLYYWLRLLKTNPYLGKKQMKLLDKALTELGSWQDYFVLRSKAKTFRKEYLIKNTPEYIHIRAVEEICKYLQEKRLADAQLYLKKMDLYLKRFNFSGTLF